MNWLYDSVMDERVNPLRNLPPAQRFQVMMYLSIVWTAVFCSSVGSWYWYGELMLAHILLAGATLVTGWTFREASRGTFVAGKVSQHAHHKTTYRDHPAEDGTARYDDVWGG